MIVIGHKPKVALVFPGCGNGVGGAESQAILFLKEFDRSILDVSLILLGSNPDFFSRAKGLTDIPVTQLCPKAVHVWQPNLLLAYWRLLRENRFDIVHLYGLRQEIATRPISKMFFNTIVVSAIRGTEDHRGKIHRLLNRMSGRFVDLWIANSDYARRLFTQRDKLPEDKIVTVYNGMDVPNAPNLKHQSDTFVIGCVANHLPDKKIEDVIVAVANLCKERCGVRLVLVGRVTEYSSTLKDLALGLGISDKVEFLGYQENVQKILQQLDVIVLASRKESFPSSLLEGMAMGLPVVAARTAGIPEMVVDGKTGFLFEVGDCQTLEKKLRILMDDSAKRSEMGSAGAARARELFGKDRLVNQLSEIYLNLCKEKCRLTRFS